MVPVRGRDHNPLGIRLPVMIMLLFLRIFTSYLEKMAMQLLSQSWESEMSVPVCKSSRTKADCAAAESWADNGNWPRDLAGMMVPLAERTVGPSVTMVGFER